jgi:ureidoacrylate peracid hydrolase
MTSALLLIDLQNDFLHPRGAYARGGASASQLAALPQKIPALVQWARAQHIPVVASRFTLWPGANGEPLIAPALARLRPFLRRGDFTAGGWGHSVIDQLGVPEFCVDKVAYSAFHQTQLDWVLRKRGVEHLVIAGIVTNGGVASTARDAHVHEYRVTVLSDACAAFTPQAHETSLADMAQIATVTTCELFCV